MAIAFVGSASGLTTALTEPAHSAGDYLIFAAFRDGSLSKPGLPAGYTEIESNTTNSAGSILAYRVGDGTAGSLTSTNATSCVCAAYSGVASLGDSGVNTDVTQLGTYPSLTMVDTSGNSWVVLVEQNRVGSSSGTATTPPAGFTHREVSSDTNDQTGLHDSDGGLSSYTGTSENMAGSANGWVTYALELVAAGGGTETVTVDAGALTLAGQTVPITETVPVSAGALTVSVQTVTVTETVPVTAGALTLAGQTVDVLAGEIVPVTAGTLTLAGQTVTVREDGTETVPVTSGSMTLAGQDVTVTETAPVTIRNRAIGGGSGLGPSSPAAIAAWEARQAELRRREQAIDDTLHGRQHKKVEARPKPPERSRKPLPPAEPPAPDPMDGILAMLEAADGTITAPLITRHDLPHYEPEEDAAFLLLMA